MSRRSLVLTVLSLLATTALSQAAPIWSTPAVGCVPTQSTLPLYSASNGLLGFLINKTGSIAFTCNVTESSSPTSLTLTYSDYSTTAGNNVVAKYYKAKKTTGAVTLVATASSDSGTAGGVNEISTTFTDTVDNATYYYFVYVVVSSTNSSNIEDFYGVNLS